MQKTLVVTIDGPVASGKSSVSRGVARALGWSWLSTGAFYRGLAYVATAKKMDLHDEAAMVKLALSPEWKVQMAEDQTRVLHNGQDVTANIYREEVGAAASLISHYPKVRQSLLQAQRDCANNIKGLVAEGRDCGTIVFPQAQVKIYLTARSENRAHRRAMEEGKSFEETRAAQMARDSQDSSRQAAPLQIPEHAHVVDTSDMGLEAVVEHVLAIVQSKLG